MTNEEIKQKRIEFVQEVIFKYTQTEPILTPEELAFAYLFHLDSARFLIAIKKESESKW